VEFDRVMNHFCQERLLAQHWSLRKKINWSAQVTSNFLSYVTTAAEDTASNTTIGNTRTAPQAPYVFWKTEWRGFEGVSVSIWFALVAA
jgi:hypothetical protein